MSSKIEQIIDDLDAFIDGCKYQPFSNTKIVVNKEELDEMIVEMRMRIPEEIKKYQKIIAQQEAILEDARTQAQNMINDAQAQIDVLVSDHEVMQRAYQRANEVVDEARGQADSIVESAVQDANSIRQGALQYADGLLADIQNIIAGTAGESRQRLDQMFDSLESVYRQCSENRSQLNVDNTAYESYENETPEQ
ncbi:MAG: vacuolar family H+-ATPase subunit H [Clostridiales bacterium]|nr:vacuolar family H+-ATPase subunit H [Clostridiales bacterium]MDO5141312.1 vacuolar family H+-ATPase subunit H [Eubacteriales bacterium]